MKNVILIGDSIRAVYDKYVQNRLRSSANVYWPQDSCRFAHYVLRHIGEWLEKSGVKGNIDVIHWNAGLHDVAHLYGEDILVPIDWYAETIERIYKVMKKLAPEAKQIFATSTCVIEEGFTEPERFFRLNSDIEAYNKIAVERLSKYDDVLINDMYDLTKAASRDIFSDPTHFYTDPGRRLLGDRVSEVIAEQLQVQLDALSGYDTATGNFYIGQ